MSNVVMRKTPHLVYTPHPNSMGQKLVAKIPALGTIITVSPLYRGENNLCINELIEGMHCVIPIDTARSNR